MTRFSPHWRRPDRSKARARSRFRQAMIERLEARELMAIDGWNNVLQPLSVLADPDQEVSPLDALVLINEINSPRYSNSFGRLPDDAPANERPPYFDVNCNGTVDPLDVLLVINHLNGGPKPLGWMPTSAESFPGAGFVSASSCAPQLHEGSSLRTGLTSIIVVPDTTSAVRVTFRDPNFDTSSTGSMQDALEIVVTDPSGNAIVLPYAAHLDATYNLSEASQAIYGPSLVTGAVGSQQSATVNLTGVAAGTPLSVTVRLLNNDRDEGTSVVITGIAIVPANGPNPTSSVWDNDASTTGRPAIPWTQLQDLTGQFATHFGRTTYTNANQSVISDVTLENLGSSATTGELIAVIHALSDLSVSVLSPDGYLADGRPYLRMQPPTGTTQIEAGGSSLAHPIRFTNPNGTRFTFDVEVQGMLYDGTVAFTSNPVLEIQAGNAYGYDARALSSRGAAIGYSLLAGPSGMAIDAGSGRLTWNTLPSDIGRPAVTIRASDPYGQTADQLFSIDIRSELVNRPPIITSVPDTDAVVQSPFEVHTFATGMGPVASGLIPNGNGWMSVVTANAAAAQLGWLPSAQSTLSPSQSLSVGEPSPEFFATPFQTGISVPLELAPQSFMNSERDIQGVTAEDVNGDGIPDLMVLANLRPSGNLNDSNDLGYVIVRLGNDDGTFREGWRVSLPVVAGRVGRAASLHYRDVTGDDHSDLVVTTMATNQTLMYPGSANGLFDTTPIVSPNLGNLVSSTQMADMDGDGFLDLVLFENTQVQIGGRQGIGIQYGDGTGRFIGDELLDAANNNGGLGYIADIDGVNGPDLVRLNYNDARIEVRLNLGSRQFDAQFDNSTRSYFASNNPAGRLINPTSAYVDDFDGDQHVDVMLSSNFGVVLLQGQGDGRFGDGTAAGNRVVVIYNFDSPSWPVIQNSDGRAKDIDGDGNPDFVFGETNSSSSVLIGLGRTDGGFDLQQYNPFFADDIGQGVVKSPRSGPFLAMADFNRDGVIDVAVGSKQIASQPGSVGLLLGNTPGSLRAPNFIKDYSYSSNFDRTQGRMGESVTGDFNNDGHVDVVTAGSIGFGYGLYFAAGRGDGSFEPSTAVLGGLNDDNSLLALDIDRDGNLDLAWLDGGGFAQAFGLGNGAFQMLPRIVAPGGSPGVSQQALQSDDVNGDGYPDLVYRLQTGNIDSNFITRIVVLLYDPDTRRYQRLADATDLITNTPRAGGFYLDESLGMGDLNNDGINEFFTFSRSIPSQGIPARWTVLEPTQVDGTDVQQLFRKTVIENPAFLPNDVSVHAWIVEDFDGDGNNDIAYSTHDAKTVVMFGRGDFTFRDATTYSTQGFYVERGDFNGDGITDLATTWGYGFLSYSQRPYNGVLMGRGDGTFSEQIGFTASTGPLNGVYVGDFNGDGIDDITGLGGLVHGEAYVARSMGLADIATGDINGDGRTDVVAIDSGLNRVKLMQGQVDQTFARQADLLTDTFPVAVELVDADVDGLLDILTANREGRSLSLFRHTTPTQFSRVDISVPMRPTDMVLGDLNGDDRLDAVVISEVDKTLVGLASVNGSFAVNLVLPLGFRPSGIALGDVNGDGRLDAVLSDHDGDRMVVLHGLGDGTFDPPTFLYGVSQPTGLGLADMNGDQRLDIVVAQPANDQIAILFQEAGGRFASPQPIAVGVHPVQIVTRDINGDGRPDVVVTNQGDDTLSVIVNRFDPNQVWRYRPTAIDPDGDAVTFEGTTTPGGMIFDAASQTFLWAPMPEQLGANRVVIRASDGRGGSAEQSFSVIVTAPVSVVDPIFTSQPVTSLGSDEVYHYQPTVAAVDSEAMRYRLVDGPVGMTIDASTGAFSWDPRTQGLQLYNNSAGPSAPVANQNYGQIQIPDAPTLRPASVTVEGWFQFQNPNGALYEQLLSKRASASNPNYVSFGLEYYYGNLRANVGKPGLNGNLATASASVPAVFGEWTHVAMTFDEDTKLLSLYVNGSLVGTAVSPESIGYNDQPVFGGSNIATLSRTRIWNYAKSATEISDGMLASIPSDSPGLVLDLQYRESRDVSTLLDSSTAKNHGRLIGLPDLVNVPQRVSALSDVRSVPVTIRVEDGQGGVTEQTFEIRTNLPFETRVYGVVYDDTNGNGVWDRRPNESVLYNTDFRSGGFGFETDFSLRENSDTYGWLGNAQVTVSNSTKAIPLTSDYVAHTYGSPQDLMLVVNGDTQDRVAWRQTVVVEPGANYDFSFWAMRPNSYEAPSLQVRVNGQPLGAPWTLQDLGLNTWKQFRASLVAGSTELVIEIVSLGSVNPPNPGLSGAENGFAIDDLLLVPSAAPRAIVLGRANPYLAGMPNGSTAFGSSAPDSSPPTVAVTPGQVLRVRATGHTTSDGFIQSRSPDGSNAGTNGSTTPGPANGISKYFGPNNGSLLGVFLDDSVPSGQTPPSDLDFRSGGNVPGGIDYTSLSPSLRQLFFIGDGWTSTGIEQTIVVPAGATRLFLANASTGAWQNNVGAFEVQVFDAMNEPVQTGRQVYIDRDGNQRYDAGERTATTQSDGSYSLLAPGVDAVMGLIGRSGALQTSPTVPTTSIDLRSHIGPVVFGSKSGPASGLPQFTSIPVTTAVAPGRFTYQAFAQATDGLPVNYELATGPRGMSIDPVSGLVRWNPIASDAGPNEVILKATDSQGQFALQRFGIEVTVNTSPIFVSSPNQIAMAGIPWEYRVMAQDAEQSELSYRLITGPAGMTLDAATGRLRYTPATTGAFTFVIEVEDGQRGSARQSADITVVPAGSNQAPVFTQAMSPYAIVNRWYAGSVRAMDPDADALVYSLVNGPSGLTLSSDGDVVWQPNDIGTFAIQVLVSDGRGGTDQATYELRSVSRAPASTLVIDSQPITAALIDQIYGYDVVSDQAIGFELLERPVGMSIDPRRGTIRWMPTRDQLGVQSVRVRVQDILGHTVEQTYQIAVRSASTVPTIASAPPTQAAVGQTYVYAITTLNPSNSPLDYSLSARPDGMQVDPQSGIITWTPAPDQIGPTVVLVQVSDRIGNFSTQAFSVLVASGASNRPPVIASTPSLEGVVGRLYQATISATDPEGASVVYAVQNAPSGLSIHPLSGAIDWTPTAVNVGNVPIVISATDPAGGVGLLSFVIAVRPENRAPTFRSNPKLQVAQGALYQYDAIAIDLDREPLSYQLIAGPSGMTIDALGRVRWQTSLTTPLGGREVSLRVSDALGGEAIQTYTMGVVADTQAPRLTIVVTGEPVLYPWTTSPAIVRVIASDNVGLGEVVLRVDGQVVELAADGTARVYFSAPGNGRLEATATDAAGNVGTAIGRVNMRSGEEDGGGNPAPEANITSVNSGSAVSGFVEIIGTAVSPDFASYTLSYRRIDQSEYTAIVTGATQVTNAALGRWDTTLLENDNYALKLEVLDTFGSFASIEVEVSVTGNLKLGNFRLSFEDMTIPVAGIPITIVRTYDTLRSDRDGDFGYGWRMEYRNTDLRTSLPASGLEDIGIYTPFKPGAKVFLTLPGGAREGFTFTPEFKVLPGYGQNNNLVIATPKFTSDRGVTSTLKAGTGALIANEYGELFTSGGIPWNPASPDFGGYTLTTVDGTVYTIDGSSGLMTSARDRNGNTLIFTESGISFGGTEALRIERDASGHIVHLEDLAGDRVTYEYAHGKLVSYLDGEGYRTRFLYDNQNRLVEIIDPLNRPYVSSEFDSVGRLVRIMDREGRTLTFEHSGSSRQQIVTDANGSATVYEYDNDGNTLRKTDALGGVVVKAFNAVGDAITTTDELGRTIQRTYDTARRILSESNANGETSYFVYSPAGDVQAITTPAGFTTRFEYDTRGNLVRRIEADGTISLERVLDLQGNAIEESDALGNRTTTEFNVFGRAIATIDPLGNRVELELQLNGTQIARLDERGGRTEFTIDRRGLVTKISGPEGRTLDRDFNALGENTGATNGHGSAIIYEVDVDGRETYFADALGNARERQYDLVGNLVVEQDALGRLTRHTYDALGRRTRTTFADGSHIAMSYDAVGNLIQQLDELGNRTRWEYDASNRVIRTVDALGRATSQSYDADGRLVRSTDPAGRITKFRYDSRSNLLETVRPDGSIVRSEFDVARRNVAQIESDGARTYREYDRANRLIAVITSDGARTRYTYDAAGKLVGQIDALGRRTQIEYNAYGQETKRIFPDGTFEQFSYDQFGFIDEQIHPDGQIVEQDFDPNGNLVRQRLPDGTEENFSYTPTGRMASATGIAGTTSMEYDARDRLIRVVHPTGAAVRYEYDAVGNRIAVTVEREGTQSSTLYSYDAIGRMTEMTSPSGARSHYEYDLAGNLSEIRHFNGIIERRTFDLMGRPTEIESEFQGVIQERLTYAYSVSGLRQSMTKLDGSRVDYQYDSQRRLVSETHTGATNAILWQEGFQYDAVGNRTGHRLNGNDVVRAFNVLDQLVQVDSLVLSYDLNGRLVSKDDRGVRTTYEYDSENQLIGIVAPGTSLQYVYDAIGNRIAENRDGVTTHYVLDLNSPSGVSQVLEDFSPTTGETSQYVYGLGRELMVTGNQVLAYQHDANGNVYRISDEVGQAVAQYVTSAFGVLIAEADSTSNSFRFADERTDESIGVVHLRARDYDLATGQFMTRDPYVGRVDDPTSLHRYIYAHQNPITNRDPTGESTLAEQAVVGGLINGFASGVTSALGGKRGLSLFSEVLVGAAFGALTGGLGGTVAKALTNDFVKSAFFANAATSSLFVKYSPRLVYAIPNTAFGVLEDLTRAAANGDYQKPGWTLNVISNATFNFVYNVVVGPANIDAYDVQKSVPTGYSLGEVGSNFYAILTQTEREKLAPLLREIVVEFGDSAFSKAEQHFFTFLNEASKFIVGAGISFHNSKKQG